MRILRLFLHNLAKGVNCSLILDSNHFSVYGVGYTASAEKYADIEKHWARESIDYAVGRESNSVIN